MQIRLRTARAFVADLFSPVFNGFVDSENPDRSTRKRRPIEDVDVRIIIDSEDTFYLDVTQLYVLCCVGTIVAVVENQIYPCILNTDGVCYIYRTYGKYWDRQAWANSVDPDQTRRLIRPTLFATRPAASFRHIKR